MKIISDFQDYYDGVGRYGADPSIVYFRKKTEHRLHRFANYDNTSRNRYHLYQDIGRPEHWGPGYKMTVFPSFDSVIVGFCGQIYPCLYRLKTEAPVPGDTPKNKAAEVELFHTPEAVDDYMKANCTSKIYGAWRTLDNDKHHRDLAWWARWNSIPLVMKHLPAYFGQKIDMKWFEHGPIFTIQLVQWNDEHATRNNVLKKRGYEYLVTCNGPLKSIGFHQVKDAYTAWQELQMYLSNQALPPKPMPVISDEDKIHTHGMDKFSFRKPKGGSKRKK